MSAPTAMGGTAARDIEKLGENHFVLEVPFLQIGAFAEIGGLQVERDVLEYAEGGVNDYVHKLPGRLKYPNLKLKRGITDQDALQAWFFDSQASAQLQTVTVKLVDATGEVRRSWAFADAFPVKWIGPKLSAGSDAGATEELEIAHGGMVRH
jgi:phage tail-like protein